ncbi:MAG: hypothetical protein RR945_00345 [Erysipelotrichaceae bacterium]
MARKSIFDLENRYTINDDCYEIFEYLRKPIIHLNEKKKESFWILASTYFPTWKYKGTCFSLESYLSMINIDYDELPGECIEFDKTTCLYFLEFLINMIWHVQCSIRYDLVFVNSYTETPEMINIKTFNNILNTISQILQKVNYKYVENKERYILTKQNFDVDSLIHISKNEDLSSLLLSYLDYSIEKNVKDKASIIASLNIYLETKSAVIKQTDNNALYKNISAIINNIGARHQHNLTKKLSKKEELYWYDACFQMIVHLLRSIEIIEIREKFKEEFIPLIKKK